MRGTREKLGSLVLVATMAVSFTLSACALFREKRFDVAKTKPQVTSDVVTNSASGNNLAAGVEHQVNLDNRDGQLKIEVAELKVKLVLPVGWKIKKKKYQPSADNIAGLAMDGTGRHEIYNTTGDLVWAISYLPYEDYPGQEKNLQAIYNQVALGNNYRFVLRPEEKDKGGDKLKILEETKEKQVIYCMHYNGFVHNKEQQISPGALVRFKQKHLFIAVYGSAMSGEKEICEFARSISLQ